MSTARCVRDLMDTHFHSFDAKEVRRERLAGF